MSKECLRQYSPFSIPNFVYLVLATFLISCGGGSSDGTFNSPTSPSGGPTNNVNTFTVSVSISGLTSGSLDLQNNGTDVITATISGVTTFANSINANGSYAVTVSSQPVGLTCTVGNGIGNGVVTNVTNITVVCSAKSYSIGGMVTGLASGQVLILSNSTSGDAKTITGTGTGSDSFTFPLSIAYLGGYSAAITSQPANETCSISGGTGSGAGVNSNINSINITCSIKTYSVSGTVSGLIAGQQVTLYNNGGDANIVIGGGTGTDAFTFATPVAYLGSYVATVNQQPINQTCSISGSTGIGYGISANANSVTLTCAINTYSIGGIVTGLVAGQQVTLYNNGGDANTIIAGGTGSDNFTFATPVAYLGSYVVTINQQPNNEVCTVSTNPSGANNVVTNVSNIGVLCSVDSYTISGNIRGLMLGDSLTLTNNGANPISISGIQKASVSQPFTFSTPIAYGSSYDVEISSTNTIYSTCSVGSNNTNYPNPTTGNVSVGISCSIYGYCHNGGAAQVCFSADIHRCPTYVTCNCPSLFSGPQCDVMVDPP
ncbi:hypothetical protein G6723_04990 [Polynucleobacter paneuropaeus]|nr:hypothetical protein G6723_04990 [Polynucleobacter paneuropaeus]